MICAHFKATQGAFTKSLVVSPQVNENMVTSSQYWKIETVTPASPKSKQKEMVNLQISS